jgi:hypothetical protein
MPIDLKGRSILALDELSAAGICFLLRRPPLRKASLEWFDDRAEGVGLLPEAASLLSCVHVSRSAGMDANHAGKKER